MPSDGVLKSLGSSGPGLPTTCPGTYIHKDRGGRKKQHSVHDNAARHNDDMSGETMMMMIMMMVITTVIRMMTMMVMIKAENHAKDSHRLD